MLSHLWRNRQTIKLLSRMQLQPWPFFSTSPWEAVCVDANASVVRDIKQTLLPSTLALSLCNVRLSRCVNSAVGRVDDVHPLHKSNMHFPVGENACHIDNQTIVCCMCESLYNWKECHANDAVIILQMLGDSMNHNYMLQIMWDFNCLHFHHFENIMVIYY